jgi:hypothetical protein
VEAAGQSSGGMAAVAPAPNLPSGDAVRRRSLGSYGLDVTRIDGTVVSVHAITDFSGKSERAAVIAEQIQAATAAVREDR